mgnify:CR=1 FL=1
MANVQGQRQHNLTSDVSILIINQWTWLQIEMLQWGTRLMNSLSSVEAKWHNNVVNVKGDFNQ